MSIIQKTIYAIILLSLSALIEVNAGEYSVIINKNIRYTGSDSEKLSFIKRLFLKKQTAWPGGIKAKPVNFKPDTPEYKAFLAKVMLMTEPEINTYWAAVRQKTGVTPPSAVSNFRVVLKLIARSKGGVGYIDNIHLEDLPDTVQVLFEF